MNDLADRLNAWLPEPTDGLILVGGSAADHAAAASRVEVVELADLADEAAARRASSRGPAEAAAWLATEGEPESVVAGIGRRLADDGLLLVAVPPAAEETPSALPLPDQTRLRSIVRCLSEEGYSVRREATIDTSTGRWRLIAGRRDGYLMRRHRNGDEAAILGLFASCFHAQRDPAHWRWKYADNPFGRRMISLAWSPRGELAAHYAGYPVPLVLADEERPRDLVAVQMGDTMTHPEHRQVGRGRSSLLARTVRHFFACHRDDDHHFFYGFNTGPIQRFCRWFIGGSQIEAVGSWAAPVEAIRHRPRWPYRTFAATRREPAFDRLLARAAPDYGVLLRRDDRYLDWRYRQSPDCEYLIVGARRLARLVGFGVFRRRDESLLWGDALFARRHAEAAGSVLRAALDSPLGRGATTVEAWFPDHPTWWRDQLTSLGFSRRPEPQGLAMMALPNHPLLDEDRLSRLYYTWGDSDLF